jgi:hypothetical protein
MKNPLTDDTEEDFVWQRTSADHLWVFDKLILSRKLGYTCGPTGIDVPEPGYYIVRPCVNALGLGLGATKEYLEKDTTHLSVGFFWCEWFEGRHVSVDYKDGVQVLAVEGTKPDNTFTQWTKWHRVNDEFPLPAILTQFDEQYLNCEYIDGKLIEVHFRRNEDFDYATEEFIPVWEGENTTPPEGYRYIQYPDVHGRIGAFVK